MLAFPMRKGDNILLYKTELEADKITKNCIDSDSSKLKIFKNGNELFHLGTYQDVINNSIDIRRCLKEAYKDNNAKIIINSKENLGEYDKYEFSNINPNTIDEIWSYYINFFQHLKNGKEIKKSTFSESNNILRLNSLKKYLESKLVLELLDQSIDKYSKIEILKSTKYEFVSHIIEFYRNLKIYYKSTDVAMDIIRLQIHYSNLSLIFDSELNSLMNIADDNKKLYLTMKKLYTIDSHYKR